MTPTLSVALLGLLVLLAPPTRASEAPAPPDLSGRWALMQLETRISDIPMLGQVTTGARALALVEIAQRGRALTLRERLCALRFESSSKRARTSVAPELARHLAPLTRKARLTWSAKKARWRFDAPKHIAVHGARLASPTTDALPEDAADPRVVDVDKDGLPGLTIQIDGIVTGRIGIVQRTWSTRRGLVRSTDRVDGLVEADREERYLRATNPFLRSPVPSRPHPDKARHAFGLRRVDGEMTCDRLIREAAKVFP